MWEKKGFTLIEILVVIVIVGILAALTLPNYMAIKEKTLDREAKANLALIRAAEKIYKMEEGNYYPSSGSISTIDVINTNLRLSLPNSLPVTSRNWAYSLDNSSSTGIGVATRSGRTWKLNAVSSSEVPACTGSCL